MDHKIRSIVEDETLIVRRRTQIVKVAVELFARCGYHSTTIRDIARGANVSVGLIYQYVGDKEDILYLCILDPLERFMNEIPAATSKSRNPLDRFRASFGAYCKVVHEHRHASIVSYREMKALNPQRIKTIMELELAANELINDCARECVEARIFRSDADTSLLTYQCVLYAQGWVLSSWRIGRPSFDEYLEKGLDLILRSVLADNSAI